MRFTKYITNAAACIVDQGVHNHDVHFSEGGKNANISKTRAVLCKPKSYSKSTTTITNILILDQKAGEGYETLIKFNLSMSMKETISAGTTQPLKTNFFKQKTRLSIQ